MKNNFAPYNDDIKFNPDKKFIAGPYSTFDIELSKLNNKQTKTIDDKKLIFEKAGKHLSKDKVIDFHFFLRNKYANLLASKSMITRLYEFESMTTNEKLSFAHDLIAKMLDIVSKKAKQSIPKIEVISSSEEQVMAFDQDNAKLLINFDEISNKEDKTFLRNLFHELIHVLDCYIPNFGPLGAQISKLSFDNYIHSDKDSDAYFKNPLERNSFQSHERIPEIVEFVKEYKKQK